MQCMSLFWVDYTFTSRESANPIPVLLLSFESQTVVFQLFDFHLRKFKKFIIKKVLLPQSDVPTLNLTMASCWRWRKNTLIMAMHLSWVMTMIRSAKQCMNICGAYEYHVSIAINRGTERQFSENICWVDDLRSRIFGTFDVKFLACLPLLGFSNN